jgi:hypothetical protein
LEQISQPASSATLGSEGVPNSRDLLIRHIMLCFNVFT